MKTGNTNVGVKTMKRLAMLLFVAASVYGQTNSFPPTSGKATVVDGSGTQLKLHYSSTYFSTFGTNLYGNFLINNAVGGLYFQTAGVSRLYYDNTNWVFNNGNVGIGMPTPSYKLDVAGDIRANNAAIMFGLNGSLDMAGDASNNLKIRNWNNDKNLSFWVRPAGVMTEAMTINGSGNVGIGTTTPNYKLDVQNGTKTAYFQNSGSWQAIDFSSDGGVTKGSFSALGNKLVIGNSGIGTSELMVLNLSTGNVGIGTASPASKLHIYSNIAENTYLQIQNGNSGRTLRMGIPTGAPYALLENQAWDNSYQAIAISPNGGNVGIGMTNPTQKLDVAGNVMVYNDILALGGGSYGYQADAGAVRMPNNKNIAWRNSANSANLYLTATPTNQFAFVGGNVLIGQTTQVNSAYKLDINGSARANEIVVNTNGADFVFEEGYKLASLDEVEKHIKTKKHLPGIASAKEMQENGVGVSELQTKLLQKVEELTLYVIELKKQNDEMKKKIGN